MHTNTNYTYIHMHTSAYISVVPQKTIAKLYWTCPKLSCLYEVNLLEYIKEIMRKRR